MSVVRATPPVRHDLGNTRRARRSGAAQTASDVRFADADEIRRWDELILRSPDEGNVYRGSDNIAGMVVGGGTPVYLIVGGFAVTAFQVRVPVSGPLWVLIGPPVADVHDLIAAAREVAAFGARHGITAVRLRTQLRANANDEMVLRAAGLRRTPTWLDDSTVLVDLRGSEHDVQARFKKRARKSIRRAAREFVIVDRVPATDDNCRVLYEMLDATSGGRFHIPSLATTTAVFQRYEQSGRGQLFLARHCGEVVVGAFVTTFGKTALYFGAGSVRKRPGDPTECGLGGSRAAYALQWEIMRWAREQGCEWYDLDGTPSSATITDESHQRHGVGQFKTAFSEEITDYLGAYQIDIRPGRAWTMRQLEICAGRVDESPLLNRLRRRPVRPNPDYVWLHRRRRSR